MQEAVQTLASTVIQLARRQWLAGSGRVLRLARVRLPEHPQRHIAASAGALRPLHARFGPLRDFEHDHASHHGSHKANGLRIART